MAYAAMKYKWMFGILLLCPIATLQSLPESPSYIGAVVEYSPVTKDKVGQTVPNANAENYLKFIEKASEYGVDILLFPESSLSYFATSYIPDPTEGIIPCLDTKGKYTNSLKVISCAARKHSMYVVVNHQEKYDCSPDEVANETCPESGALTYNTNVAFDRTGKVVARYRKFHLFGEVGVNVTASPEYSTFRTDFGVTFGQFICFDLLFEQPALGLVHDLGITDILFPAHWFSDLPHMFASQSAAGWAFANDVNMLSAQYSNPYTASGGSGIYMGRKGYVHVTSENKKSNILIVSEIPKVIEGKRSLNINSTKLQIYEFSKNEISTSEDEQSGHKDYIYHTIEDLKPYTTELINLQTSFFNKTICNEGMCCDFDLKYNFDKNLVTGQTNFYRYRAAIFNGIRNILGDDVAFKICGIVACLNEDLKSCGQVFRSTIKLVPTTFEHIDISLPGTGTDKSFFMPISLTEKIMPLNATDYFYEHVDRLGSATYKMGLKNARNDLINFSIFGRYYS